MVSKAALSGFIFEPGIDGYYRYQRIITTIFLTAHKKHKYYQGQKYK
jgi:hypothetical protein